MAVQDRINKISTFFKGMNVDSDSGIIYLTLVFPEKWTVNPKLLERFNVNYTNISNIQGGYYFFTELTVGFDALFDSVDSIISFNLQIQEKIDLLQSKINELKAIFQENDMSVLKTLKFSYKTKKNRLKKEISKEEEENKANVEENNDKMTEAVEEKTTDSKNNNSQHLKDVLSKAKSIKNTGK